MVIAKKYRYPAMAIITIIIILSIGYYKPMMYLKNPYLWHIDMGYRYYDIYNLRDASHHADKAFAIDRSRPEAYLLKAYILRFQRKLPQSELYAEMVIEDFPIESRLLIANIRLADRNYDEALNILSEAEAIRSDWRIDSMRSMAYMSLGKEHNAFLESDSAINKCPHCSESFNEREILAFAYAIRGLIYEKNGHQNQANTDYSIAEDLLLDIVSKTKDRMAQWKKD